MKWKAPKPPGTGTREERLPANMRKRAFLDTVLGDVLGAHTFGVGDHIVVGVHRNHHSLWSLDFEPRGEVTVIWKLAIESVSAHAG